jgi:ABC-type cobalamin/Fe3+-siderophores transport system ATPase subunit
MQSTVDDVIIINNGELMVQGSLKEVIGAGTLEEAFLKLAVGGDK